MLGHGCGKPGAFQEAIPVWTQRYPGGFQLSLATLDAGLRPPTAAGEFLLTKTKDFTQGKQHWRQWGHPYQMGNQV